MEPSEDLLGDLGEQVHSASELAQRRARERTQRRRAGQQRLLVLVVGVVVLVVLILLLTSNSSKHTPTATTVTSPLAAKGVGAGSLAPGFTAAGLPGNILIADRNNGRLVVISPAGQVVWSQRLAGPSDAYVSPSGKSIVVTQHGAFVVLVFGIASRKIDYHYGHSGRAGVADNRLHDPQTGQELTNGELLIADKSNCRILVIKRPVHRPIRTLGTPGSCVHSPPKDFAYPDAAFPTTDGGLVVTELDPAWVDVLDSSYHLVDQLPRPVGLSAPYDANEYASGDLIATDHARPGAVAEFTTSGKLLWRYGPTSGAGELDRPTLAQVLPGGNVLVSDAGDDRVVVIDAQTKKIIWQYGISRHPGSTAGHLHTPDSAVLVP